MNVADARLPEHFSGIVRLFPLPNLVLFPGVVQALHIFEPRYRKMMSDLMAADQLVTLCLYQEPEKQFDANIPPPVHNTVCVSKVIAHKELDDGCFNLLVVGVKRAKIVRELPVEQPYRMAEVSIVEDELPHSASEIAELRNQLIANCKNLGLFGKLSHQLDLEKVVQSQIDVGMLVDLISFSADLNCLQRQSVLELGNVELRLKTLIKFLSSDKDASPQQKFPPDFSNN